MTSPGLSSLAFTAPRSLPELCRLLAERSQRGQQTVLLAGGTDWYVERHSGIPLGGEPAVADLTRIEALRAIEMRGDRLLLGAAVTYADLLRHAEVRSRVPLLSDMARTVGASQIQARGTLGGNLATGSPAADGVAALAALDADVVLANEAGERTCPLSAFYTGYRRTVLCPGEVIARVELPLPPAGSRHVWRKVGARQAQAISKVALAGVGALEGGRLVRLGLGMASVAPTVVFLEAVRSLGTSRPTAMISADELDRATAESIAPIDDVRSTAAYRSHVARALVRNFFRDLGAPV